MFKKRIWSLFAPLIVFSISMDARAQARGQGRPAPSNMPGTFTFVPKADLEAVMGPTRGDRPARVVNVSGGANLGEYILRYPPIKNRMPPASFYHREISELYYVIRGEGTALLGGELENPTWRPENTVSFKQVSGPGVAGTIKSYKTLKWGPGDIVIVPAGVPHTIGFEVTVTNDILRVVIDPKRGLKLVTTHEQSLVTARDDSNSDAIRQVRGPSVNGTMKNYQTVKWTAGDTIIVPAGVPHAMGQEVTERTDILRVVFDPKRSIQLK